MKRICLAAVLLIMSVAVNAQTTENYMSRYNVLVSRVGYAGIGVETLLDKWEKADPADINQMVARFNFNLARSMRDSVVTSYRANYLGLNPLLEMRDSAGRKVYYFNEKVFDASRFALAIESIDQAISMENDRLDLMIMKADALSSYEKESPDQSLNLLLSMVDRNFTSKSKWVVPGMEVTEEDFLGEIQNFALIYFNTASPQSYEAFRRLTERVLKYRPKQTNFIDNMGAYYVSARKDDKKALKYYNKSIKIDPADMTAHQNISLIKRREALKKQK